MARYFHYANQTYFYFQTKQLSEILQKVGGVLLMRMNQWFWRVFPAIFIF